MKRLWLFFLCIVLSKGALWGLVLDRVIISTDRNPTYIDFWPLVSQAWKKFVHVKPTVALIAKADVEIDETLGDVVRFEQIPDIPNWFYAQVVRLLLPAYYPEEVCIVSDMDMLPLNGAYFIDSVKNLPSDSFVVYRDKSGDGGRYPMCYVAAKGKIFGEMFHVNSLSDIPNIVYDWYKRGFGWDTDEVLLREHAVAWHNITGKCIKLGHDAKRRIDRSNWHYNAVDLKKKHYVEAHMLRPYGWYKTEINKLAQAVGLRV